TTFVGPADQGISGGMLTALVAQMEQDRKQEAARKIPTFTWIELRKGSQVVSQRQPVTNTVEIDCRMLSPGKPPNFVKARTLSIMQSEVGFHLLSLPITASVPTTFTLANTIGEPSP